MNFLAHIYLSGTDDLVSIGNFMADGVKGRDYLTYPKDIRNGILLHRFIDSYTDTHQAFRQSTKRLHSLYSHYSGVLVDMFYDHFLCKYWSEFSSEDLSDYVNGFYVLLHKHNEQLTDRAKYLLPYMERENWLYNYQFLDKFEQILTQMDSRTQYRSQMRYAIRDLITHYDNFEAEFRLFFPDIQKASQQELEKIRQTEY